MSQRTALRLLEQATWGPTAADAALLQHTGFESWFKAQVTAPLSPIPAQPLLGTDGKAFTNVGPLQQNFYANTLNGSDQLRQRVAFALSEIWVVSNQDLDRAAAFPLLLQIFQKNAFGNYQSLMQDVTLNPAMGHYLDMANNVKGNPAKNTAANENYARECMQLFTMGLNKLNKDGSVVMSGGLAEAAYTQDTVTNLARVFTGWTYAPVAGAKDETQNPINFLAPMEAHETEHDTTAKSLLGVAIPAGQTALADVDQALNIIFEQPSVAPFVSKQLIQHLVTSNPSAEYVSRVASVFENNGRGTRGDLMAVVYQILTDPEARAGDTQPFTSAPEFGHFREPVLFVANLLRGLNGQLTAASNVQASATLMGQNLFNSPSVFSYFPPDYLVDGLTAPELDIYNTQTSVSRTGVVNAAIFDGQLDANTKFNLTPFVTAAAATGQTASGQTAFFTLVNDLFFHDAMSAELQTAMQQAMAAVTTPTAKAQAGLYIALTSNEYQVIH
jgi:uncharacterized protein (DUF1800 family)